MADLAFLVGTTPPFVVQGRVYGNTPPPSADGWGSSHRLDTSSPGDDLAMTSERIGTAGHAQSTGTSPRGPHGRRRRRRRRRRPVQQCASDGSLITNNANITVGGGAVFRGRGAVSAPEEATVARLGSSKNSVTVWDLSEVSALGKEMERGLVNGSGMAERRERSSKDSTLETPLTKVLGSPFFLWRSL
ncbi:hypothetical protein EYF80_048391 [Liparis tanakae]|uniref:Uncharacterized protein n=1 Tax=Liparis tanakae TaxID=230148 RepID=A0A4Z2FJV3_9TELE|nr:hypothetical protein EYF80_048391 [Liparis tanakae]